MGNNNNRYSSYNHIHRSNINENHCGDNNNYSRTLQRLILKRTSIKKTCNIKRGGLKWRKLCVSVLICVCGSACWVGVRQCESEKEGEREKGIKVWLLLAISFWRTRLVDIWQTDKKDKKKFEDLFSVCHLLLQGFAAVCGQIIISFSIATFSNSLHPAKLTAPFIWPNKKDWIHENKNFFGVFPSARCQQKMLAS